MQPALNECLLNGCLGKWVELQILTEQGKGKHGEGDRAKDSRETWAEKVGEAEGPAGEYWAADRGKEGRGQSGRDCNSSTSSLFILGK